MISYNYILLSSYNVDNLYTVCEETFIIMIKFLDIYKQDKHIHNFLINKIRKLFKKGDFILGDEVKIFERNFALLTKSKFAIGCANGTDALTLALKSLNLKKGSEVIIPAMTYCSTAFSVINANLKPVLVDIDYKKPTINIDEIKKKITRNTKVIMPVHLYGSVVEILKIRKIIKDKEIFIIDDCAQAHGAKDQKGRPVGSLSDISTFSLYPGKNLGAYGDAGIITTNLKSNFMKIQKIRNLGSIEKFKHDLIGMNSRLDTIQALILNEKIKNLNKYNNKRRAIARFYKKNIKNKKISQLTYSKNCVYHQYVVLVNDRLKFSKYLDKKKIQYGFHYPKSIHELKVFKKKNIGKKFPNSELISKNGISLPIDPNLSMKDLKFICKNINEF